MRLAARRLRRHFTLGHGCLTNRHAYFSTAANVIRAMDAPLFSIIVPTFNIAATLPACLDSLASQTCRDFELVLVDGGSTDGTPDIANSYGPSLDGRLVIHCGPDQGPYDAMNHGVGLATGAWLLFLGADDTLYEADTLARVAAFIGEKEPSDLVYGDVIMRSNSSRYAGVFDLHRLLYERNICHQAIFYRRELFAGIGPYNLRYRIWADWDFNIRCFSNPALVTRYIRTSSLQTGPTSTGSVSRWWTRSLKKRLPKHGLSALQVLDRIRATVKRKGDPQDGLERGAPDVVRGVSSTQGQIEVEKTGLPSGQKLRTISAPRVRNPIWLTAI